MLEGETRMVNTKWQGEAFFAVLSWMSYSTAVPPHLYKNAWMHKFSEGLQSRFNIMGISDMYRDVAVVDILQTDYIKQQFFRY